MKNKIDIDSLLNTLTDLDKEGKLKLMNGMWQKMAEPLIEEGIKELEEINDITTLKIYGIVFEEIAKETSNKIALLKKKNQENNSP
jgi:hypothetical protein